MTTASTTARIRRSIATASRRDRTPASWTAGCGADAVWTRERARRRVGRREIERLRARLFRAKARDFRRRSADGQRRPRRRHVLDQRFIVWLRKSAPKSGNSRLDRRRLGQRDLVERPFPVCRCEAAVRGRAIGADNENSYHSCGSDRRPRTRDSRTSGTSWHRLISRFPISGFLVGDRRQTVRPATGAGAESTCAACRRRRVRDRLAGRRRARRARRAGARPRRDFARGPALFAATRQRQHAFAHGWRRGRDHRSIAQEQQRPPVDEARSRPDDDANEHQRRENRGPPRPRSRSPPDGRTDARRGDAGRPISRAAGVTAASSRLSRSSTASASSGGAPRSIAAWPSNRRASSPSPR